VFESHPACVLLRVPSRDAAAGVRTVGFGLVVARFGRHAAGTWKSGRVTISPEGGTAATALLEGAGLRDLRSCVERALGSLGPRAAPLVTERSCVALAEMDAAGGITRRLGEHGARHQGALTLSSQSKHESKPSLHASLDVSAHAEQLVGAGRFAFAGIGRRAGKP
jgi:hypothetical protein